VPSGVGTASTIRTSVDDFLFVAKIAITSPYVRIRAR